MPGSLAAVVLAAVAGLPAASNDAAERFLEQLNAARREAGHAALQAQPVLVRAVRPLAAELAAGAAGVDRGALRDIGRRLRDGGYTAANWSTGALVGSPVDDLLGAWRQARPEWIAGAIDGDFEHAGIAAEPMSGGLVLVAVLARSAATADRRKASGLSDLEAVRSRALAVVNDHRREHRRSQLGADPRLDQAAQAHAEDMLHRGYYGHRDTRGYGPLARARQAGFSGAAVAENISKGPFDPETAVEGWMRSSGHRHNVLHRRATHMGLGVAFGDTDGGLEILWVQLFAIRP